jgi:hypothetical protein
MSDIDTSMARNWIMAFGTRRVCDGRVNWIRSWVGPIPGFL